MTKKDELQISGYQNVPELEAGTRFPCERQANVVSPGDVLTKKLACRFVNDAV